MKHLTEVDFESDPNVVGKWDKPEVKANYLDEVEEISVYRRRGIDLTFPFIDQIHRDFLFVLSKGIKGTMLRHSISDHELLNLAHLYRELKLMESSEASISNGYFKVVIPNCVKDTLLRDVLMEARRYVIELDSSDKHGFAEKFVNMIFDLADSKFKIV